MAAEPLRLAHRGDWREAPENTLAALLAGARKPGCDGVEFDVRLSRDRVPVVIHDATLERVQGVDAEVASLSAAELEGHGVASLEAVLGALPRRAFLDVELKVVPGAETVAVLAAGRGPDLHRAAISSFDPTALEAIAHLAPAWPRWLNAVVLDAQAVAQATRLGCTAVSGHWRSVRPASVRLARDAGLQVVAWTGRRRSTYARLARLGVFAICAEGPALDG